MTHEINIKDVYDKPISFLFGSGSSFGLFPTLALGVKGNDGSPQSLETLAAHFDEDPNQTTALFMHYYANCVRPAQIFSADSISTDAHKSAVLNNYRTFLETILQILQRRKSVDVRCNIFTTNYDGCFPIVADSLVEQGNIDFVLNDGTRGFQKRYLQPRAFNSYLCQTGIFERSVSAVPQINLIHLHGSVYWKKDGANVLVDYASASDDDLLSEELRNTLLPFSAALLDDTLKVDDIPKVDIPVADRDAFWNRYKTLPIVNPTKWKFHETVFEEHYYQMLRMLSYELERPNSVLITFGFSFADEHVLSLVKRSLSNPSLKMFVCCFDDSSYEQLSTEFRLYRNVSCVQASAGVLDFTLFNKTTFTLSDAGKDGTTGLDTTP